MNTKEIFIAHPKNKKEVNALKAFFNESDIEFEVSNQDESPYNKKFVADILKGEEDYKAGRGKSYSIKELSDLWK